MRTQLANRFEGEWNEFVTFNKPVDIRPMLEKRGMMAVIWRTSNGPPGWVSTLFRPITKRSLPICYGKNDHTNRAIPPMRCQRPLIGLQNDLRPL